MNQILELILQRDKSTGLVRLAYKTFEKSDVDQATNGLTIVTANLEDFPKNAAGNSAFGRVIRWLLEGGADGTAPPLIDQQEWDEARQIVEMRAIGGDVDAQNALAGIYLEDALQHENVEMLDLADKWFRRSANGGNRVAANFVETVWSDIRLEYESRITKKKS